ncbi:MAG TPA: hypothetical protein VFJ66_08090 [Gaiellales bacterium]|nr:hypothetical protein [Gaiellales bacterium]
MTDQPGESFDPVAYYRTLRPDANLSQDEINTLGLFTTKDDVDELVRIDDKAASLHGKYTKLSEELAQELDNIEADAAGANAIKRVGAASY